MLRIDMLFPTKGTTKRKSWICKQKSKPKIRKKLQIKALVDLRCTYTVIDEQLVKGKRIQTKLVDFSFEIFNIDSTKNREVIRIA